MGERKILPLSRPGDAPLDWWSLVHLACGGLLGLVVGNAWAALALVLGYEVLEAGLRRVKVGGRGLFEHESWPNIGADIVIGMLGWAATAVLLPVPTWHLV